jgi:tetratricopeptide (TPR) repeat protein
VSTRNDGRASGNGRVYQASGDQHISEHHHYAPDWTGPDSVRHPPVSQPLTVLRDRTTEMDRLRAAVVPGAGNSVYVLHGLGGCGKTAVALALFRHATSEAGRIGLWVNASDPSSLRAGMLAVAADRDATDAELAGARSGLRPTADLVWHYLDRSGEPWLLVLDAADTPAILHDGGWLRTSPAGTVIVTSRQAGARWWPDAELMQFGVLPRDEAALVLRDLAPDAGSAEDAAEVADRLGRLPLALILAGGYLAGQIIEPVTLADYRFQLDSGTTDPIELLDQGAIAADSEPRYLVSRTWQLSLDALRLQGLPEATHLLWLLSCWAGDPLPLSLLSAADLGADLPASRVERALRGLVDQSLTELVPGIRSLRTHGMLLSSVARSVSDDQREELSATAARLLSAHLPEVPERGSQDPLVTVLAPHVLALLRRVAAWRLSGPSASAAAECALRLVIAVHRSGDYASALTLAREASGLADSLLGSDHVLSLRLSQRVGRALCRLGHYEEARSRLAATLDECERVLGPDAPESLDACFALASPLSALGHKEEALALCMRTAADRAVLFGNIHPLTLYARMTMLIFATGPDADQIIADGPQLIEDCRRPLGADSELAFGAELNYAYALFFNADRPREALPHYRAAFSAYERVFGPDFPITASALYGLTRVLAALNQRKEAVACAEEVTRRYSQTLGPDHPHTHEAKNVLKQLVDDGNGQQ